MTIEGGSKRHPAGKNYPAEGPISREAGLFAQIPAWETYRTLDPVRAAALTAAVQIACAEIRDGRVHTWESVVDRAATFEAWLDPKEADGDTAPHPFVSGQPATTSEYARCLLITGPQSICGLRRDDPAHKEAD